MFKTLQHKTCLGRTILNSSNKDIGSFKAAKGAFMQCYAPTRVGARSIVFLKKQKIMRTSCWRPLPLSSLAPQTGQRANMAWKQHGTLIKAYCLDKNSIYFLLICTIFLCGQGQSVLSTQFFSDCQDNSTRLTENTWLYQMYQNLKTVDWSWEPALFLRLISFVIQTNLAARLGRPNTQYKKILSPKSFYCRTLTNNVTLSCHNVWTGLALNNCHRDIEMYAMYLTVYNSLACGGGGIIRRCLSELKPPRSLS